MIKAIFFDLDGTLLPLKDSDFTSLYVKLLVTKLANHGYDPDKMITNIKTLMKLMYENDGSKTSEEVFLELFSKEYGNKVYEDKDLYDSFYKNEFSQLKTVCGENDLAKDIVKYAKEKTGLVVLATNSLLPHEAVKTRISFLGLTSSDFDYISKYETLHCTKPNPNFFKEILTELNLKPEEVIMFGNNASEDGMCALQAGIKTYLVDIGCLIYPEYVTEKFEIINFNDIPNIIDKEIELNK